MSDRKTKLDGAYKSLVIISIVTLAILYAGNLIMPILFSGLVSIVLVPFADFFERKKLPRGLAALITVLGATFLFFGIIVGLVVQSQEIVEEVPKLVEQKIESIDLQELEIKSKSIVDYVESHISTIEEMLDQVKVVATSILRKSLVGLKDAISFLFLCPIYIFFMLLCREHIFRFVMAYHSKTDQSTNDDEGVQLIQRIKGSLFHYLKGLSLIMLTSGTLTFLGLYFIGLDYALFLGALTAVLTPIPYIGVTISAVIPILLAFITKDSLWYVGGVLIVFAIVQFNENYILTPRIMGKSININPLMIILGLIIFGTLTGVLGMILTVPIMAVSKVIIDHYPHLRPWKYLLEDEYSE